MRLAKRNLVSKNTEKNNPGIFHLGRGESRWQKKTKGGCTTTRPERKDVGEILSDRKKTKLAGKEERRGTPIFRQGKKKNGGRRSALTCKGGI